MTPTCSKICSFFSLIKRILCKCNIFPISMIHISNVGSASDFQCGKIRQHAESNSLYQPRFCCHHTKQCILGFGVIVLFYTSERWPNSRFQKWLSLWHVRNCGCVSPQPNTLDTEMISLERTYFGTNEVCKWP